MGRGAINCVHWRVRLSLTLACGALLALTALASPGSVTHAAAATCSTGTTVTGAYDTGDGTDGNLAAPPTPAPSAFTGPWTLTSTVTPATFSYVDLVPADQTITFAELTSLSASFVSATGAGGGSPRISVGLNDGGTENFLHIYLGTSPNYTDTATSLNTYSGVNLIGNNDAGRYDDSNFATGSPATTYSNALALVGALQVEEVDFVLDTFDPYGDRSVVLQSIDGCSTAPETIVPEAPGAALLLVPMLPLAGALLFRRRNHRAAEGRTAG